MEVVGAYLEVMEGQRMYSFGLNVNDTVLVLQRTFHQNEFAARYRYTLPFVR